MDLGDVRLWKPAGEECLRFFHERHILFARCELHLEALWTVEVPLRFLYPRWRCWRGLLGDLGDLR